MFLLGFCSLLLLILWLFQTVFLDAFYRNIKVLEIKNNASVIAENIDSQSLKEIMKDIFQDGDISIEVITTDGEQFYSSNPSAVSMVHKIPAPTMKKLLANVQGDKNEFYQYVKMGPRKPPAPREQENHFFDKFPSDKNAQIQSLIYVKRVINNKGEPLIIIIHSMISPVNATVTTLRYQLYVITGIMFILSVLLAFLIAKRVSKPIEEINKSAKVLAKGNYDIHFEGKGFLEICELSDTLNATSKALNQVESLRRELLANISHDMRTPLSLIYGYAEVMHDFPEEITQEQTQTIMDETNRLTTLVNDALDISKLETGIQQMHCEEYNITQSIKSTIDRVGELVKKDGFTLEFRYDKDVFICADEIKVTQAFYNLLLNAINYTGQDKRVMVQQQLSQDWVTIEVIDTGDGIADENLPNIWDRYYKLDKHHKRAVTGSGLGLSIVKKVLDMHQGQCGVQSELGKGSTFWFALKLENK